MKKGICALAVLGCAVIVASVVVFPRAESALSYNSSAENNSIINVADTADTAPDAAKVLETRFLNMLNHNYVYGEAFYSVEDIVNYSMPALLDLREEDGSYIKSEYVSDYVYNMFGIEITDFSDINADFEQRDGYVFILPRGYEVYKHSVISVTANEDGTYTVKTEVEVATHDGSSATEICETLFVRNTQSQFGFNIVHSNFLAEDSAV